MNTLLPILRMVQNNNANYTPFDMLSLVDDLFTLDTPSRSHRSYNTTPRANITKTDTGYGIELAAPGFSRDEFEMTVDTGRLTIQMGTEDTKEYEDSLVHREYRYADFKRSFTLPENTNIESISARYEAGILYVDIPVEEKNVQSRVITVE
jgi:HSP20 family protein